MKTVKLYLIKQYEAFSIHAIGERFSLMPWGENTIYDKGYDDGGKEYYLPEGYEVSEDATGYPHIYYGNTCCELAYNNGYPVILNPKFYNGYVGLKKAEIAEEKIDIK